MTLAQQSLRASVDETIVVASPSSLALDGIERFFRRGGNVVDLEAPLKRLGVAGELEVTPRVRVICEPHPNQSIIARHHARLGLQWEPEPQGPFPAFDGTLIILPLGVATELRLSGRYRTPFGSLGMAFDDAIGNRLAQAMGRALLQQLKSVLESEYDIARTVKSSTLARARPILTSCLVPEPREKFSAMELPSDWLPCG